MTTLAIILAVWLIPALIFYLLIRREGAKQSAQPNAFQVLVAVFWPIWLIWYAVILVKEKING